MEDFRLIVSADLAARAYACVPTEETYYLDGFKAEPCPHGGVLLIATDGHNKLIVLKDPDGVIEGTAIVKLSPAMLKACKAKKGRPGAYYNERFLIVDGQRAAVAFTQCEAGKRADLIELARNPTHKVECFQPAETLIDASFPDWRRVMPYGERQPVAASFNGKYIADLAAALSQNKAPSVQVQGRGSSVEDAARSPHYVFGDGTVAGFAVLMPDHDIDREVPAWFSEPAPAANVVSLKRA